MADGQALVVHAHKFPHPALAAHQVPGLAVKDGVALNHLLEDVLEFIIRGEGRCGRGLLQQGFNKFTADVLLFFRQLRLEAKPKDGPTAVVVGRWFIDMDKNGLAGDINEVERALFLGVAVERTVVNRTRTVLHLEIPHPLRNVRVGGHDAVEVAFCKSGFVCHGIPLLSSPP